MGYIGNAPYNGVITGDSIQDGTVDTADITNDAVTTVKIADGAVTAGKLAAGAIPDPTTLEDSSGNTVVDASSGYVGIGTSNPSYTLDAVGGCQFNANTGSDYLFRFSNSSSAGYGALVTAGNGTQPIMKLRDYAGNDRVYFSGNGNVGIGTNSPSSDNGTTVFLHIGSSAKAAAGLVLEDDENKWEILTNGSLAIADGSSERMRIDSSGRVTMPYQPCFRATLASDFSNGSGATKVTGWTTSGTMGSYYGDGSWNSSNSRFTAPVAGKYMFNATSLHNVGSGWRRLYFYVNGNKQAEFLHGGHAYSDSWDHTTGSAILSLSANDYVELYADQMNSGYMYASYTQFDGYLLG